MTIIERMNIPKWKRAGHGLAALALVSGAQGVLADPVVWVAGDGAWENPANWSGGTLPTATDFVGLPDSNAVTSTASSNLALELENHASLSVTAGKLSVVGTIDSFAPLAVNNGAAVDAGRIIVEAAPNSRFEVDGLTTAVNVTQGVFNFLTFTISNGSSVTAESFDNFQSMALASGAHATANSMINHGSTGSVSVSSGATLTINGNITNERTVTVDSGVLVANSIFNHDGLFLHNGNVTLQSLVNQAGDSSLVAPNIGIEGGSFTATDLVTNHGEIGMSAAVVDIHALDNHSNVKIGDGAQLSGQDINNDGGKFAVLDGGVRLSGRFLNNSEVLIGETASLQAAHIQQTAGTFVVGGGTIGATDAFGTQIIGGTLHGYGSINGDLVINDVGVLDPTKVVVKIIPSEISQTAVFGSEDIDAVGHFNVAGGLDLLGGTFSVDLRGTSPTDYDLIDAQGAAILGGTLKVSLLDGFKPVLGDAFDIILANSITGAFGNILLPTLSDGLKFTTLNGGTFFRLQVAAVPLPAPALLFGGALGVLGFAARRRPRA